MWRCTEANQEEAWWPGDYGPGGGRTASCRIQQAVDDIWAEVARLAALIDTPFFHMMIGPWENQNFRRLLWPEYKTHRRRCDSPVGMHWVRKRLLEMSGTNTLVALPHEEADDVIGHWMTDPHAEGKRVVWSPDKDMLQIPGLHMNDEGIITPVSLLEADYMHMYQTLIGDTSDGFPGCKGVGPVKARQILDITDRKSWWPAVLKAYKAAGFSAEFALNQARVARILRFNELPGEWAP